MSVASSITVISNGHAKARPRIVVAGGGALAAKVAAAAGGAASVVAVPGVLAALAEVAKEARRHRGDPQTTDRHQRTGDRVVVAASCLSGIEATTLATFHELGVGDRVLLVDPPTEHHLHAATAGLPGIRSVDDLAAWQSALAIVDMPGKADAQTKRDGGATASGLSPAPEPPASGKPERQPVEAKALDPEAVRLDTRGGDAELVQAILDIGAEGGKRAPRVALAIAQERSGIDGLGFVVHERGEVPDEQASAVVAFRGETFGHLHAAPQKASSRERTALADQLQPWADWLARWIALDQQARRLRDMAMRDELTGVWNRRYFDRFLGRLLERAGQDRRQVTLMVFDIDDFKKYNDTHGHAAGDEILAAAAQLMLSVVRDHDVVARIGGDEFAVIFWDAERPREEGSTHPDDVANIAKRFQAAVCELRFPVLARTDMDTLTISGGLAGFPWDGRTPAELLHHADLMAMESKRKGKNALTFGAGALRCELPPG